MSDCRQTVEEAAVWIERVPTFGADVLAQRLRSGYVAAIEQARAEERERCAVICDEEDDWAPGSDPRCAVRAAARRIRALPAPPPAEAETDDPCPRCDECGRLTTDPTWCVCRKQICDDCVDDHMTEEGHEIDGAMHGMAPRPSPTEARRCEREECHRPDDANCPMGMLAPTPPPPAGTERRCGTCGSYSRDCHTDPADCCGNWRERCEGGEP